MIAGKVGDAVLKFQTDTDAQYTSGDDTQDYNYSSGSDYFTTVTQEDLFSKYHVSVSPLLILEIYLLGTGVVFVSIVIPAFMIMRLNPKQILMEQN
jgi:ABC-type antimicrobial peptide transport system permease subunit